MVCITIKFQKCGKENCHCGNDSLHGPYFWLITYKKRSRRKKGKYIWVYLGKNAQTVKENIVNYHNSSKWTDQEWKNFQEKITYLDKKSKDYSKNYSKIDQKEEVYI